MIIKCVVYVNFLVNIIWFKDGWVILDGVNFICDISILMLVFKIVNDFGLYLCNVINSKGIVWYYIIME